MGLCRAKSHVRTLNQDQRHDSHGAIAILADRKDGKDRQICRGTASVSLLEASAVATVAGYSASGMAYTAIALVLTADTTRLLRPENTGRPKGRHPQKTQQPKMK